jgi:hypothetical protein
MDGSSSKVKNLLKMGNIKLYHHPQCDACKHQFGLLKINNLNNFGNSLIDCSLGNCDGIEGYPTWEYGKIRKSGSMKANEILKSFNIKKKSLQFSKNKNRNNTTKMISKKKSRKKKLKFGNFKSNSSLSSQPQPYGYTPYNPSTLFRAGNALSCSNNKTTNVFPQMQAYQNFGAFEGIRFGGLKGGSPPINSKSSKYGTTPTNIYQTPNPYINGARLPRPYGPRDNSRMKSVHWAGSKLPPFNLDWNYQLGQFGIKPKKIKKNKTTKTTKTTKTKNKKRKSLKKRSLGMGTPGTKSWQKTLNPGYKSLPMKWVPNKTGVKELRGAKGFLTDPSLLYMQSSQGKYPYGMMNAPMQFYNNQYNTPLTAKFGSYKSYKKPKRRKSKLSKRNHFGNGTANFPSLYQMEGPNNVAYRPNMLLYNGRNNFEFGAGANTTNWETGRTYRPPEMNIEKVQYDPAHPTAWLSTTPGLKAASGRYNGARKFTNLGMNNFHNFGTPNQSIGANLIYSNQGKAGSAMAGPNTWEQNLPRRMLLERGDVIGDYATYKYGGNKKKNKRSFKKKLNRYKSVKKNKNKKNKNLSTKFGGKTIILDPKGNISIN